MTTDIFLHLNANFTLILTKSLPLLGDFVPRPPTGSPPLDPAGGPSAVSPNRGDRSTPISNGTDTRVLQSTECISCLIHN